MKKYIIALSEKTRFIKLSMPDELFKLWGAVEIKTLNTMPNGKEIKTIYVDDKI